jgi:molecular chaperone DnaJ
VARSSRLALLIAVGNYVSSDFRQLRSPAVGARALGEVLGHQRIGGFAVKPLVDFPVQEVRRSVEEFFTDRLRDDFLLIYISCHGVKDAEGNLYFAMSDTNKNLLASTGLGADFLRQQMSRCRARTIIILLDCCYSGAFLPGFKGDSDVHIKDELSGQGRVVITATSRTEYAWEGEELVVNSPSPSRFTGAIIEGLRSGKADLDSDGRVTVDELYEYVFDSMQRTGTRQTPRYWAEIEYRIVLSNVYTPKEDPRRFHHALQPTQNLADLMSKQSLEYLYVT